jgi:hypothetical protein
LLELSLGVFLDDIGEFEGEVVASVDADAAGISDEDDSFGENCELSFV